MTEHPDLLEFNALLISVGLNPATVVMLRHRPEETSLRRVLPWLVKGRPDLFMTYQRIQWPAAERLMVRATEIAAFIGQAPGTATFAGLFQIDGWERLDRDGYMAFPGNPELMELGMVGMRLDASDPIAFNLIPLPQMSEFIGRMIVQWPKPERTWARWAARGVFPIAALLEESRLERDMPDWTNLVLNWAELATLPRRWRTSLSEWRGIYFIYDGQKGRGYVGSASGAENILGRWLNYAQTGHGGNKGLRESSPNDLRFSILQRVSPDMLSADIILIENSWKYRLHTLTDGLNQN